MVIDEDHNISVFERIQKKLSDAPTIHGEIINKSAELVNGVAELFLVTVLLIFDGVGTIGIIVILGIVIRMCFFVFVITVTASIIIGFGFTIATTSGEIWVFLVMIMNMSDFSSPFCVH